MSASNSTWYLLLLLSLPSACSSKGKPIDLFNQEGGDILQLRTKTSNTFALGGRMHNALLPSSPKKWNYLEDGRGNYIIPYKIVGKYDEREKRVIESAMESIQDNTCIRFKQRNDERDYVEIHNENEGCYTWVGRSGGRTILMLQSNYAGTCIVKGTVIHELFHLIGLWHEQSRYDRDDYIKIHFENIAKGESLQFRKLSRTQATTYDVPYDYGSVMHYGKKSFSANGKITIETLDPRFQDVIGQRTGASASDFRKVCEIYRCGKCMGRNFKQETSTKKPVVQTPTSLPGGACIDRWGNICKILASVHHLRCEIKQWQCCATCAALNEGKDLSKI
ncbi:unnamed protein product [Cylicocyclus nassatus]|uniref:Metalloendopeptidase n=1 Tax=Cylicocyclus nassatus TaxID=53992 RepID=A0AA36GPS7_CYLNA|nr:unnamed protein product [Cylicocyclus nassatus]